MTVTGALREIRRTLMDFDHIEYRLTGVALTENGSRSWQDWQQELDSRVNAVARETRDHGRPTTVMLASLGCQVVAMMLAVARAQDADVAAGDPETAA